MIDIEPRLFELARVGAGKTQGQLAKELNKSQPFVSQVERGEKLCPEDLLPSWAEMLGVPTSFFTRGVMPLPDSRSGMVHRKMKTLPAKPFNLANAQVKMRAMEVDSLMSEIEVVPALPLPQFPDGYPPIEAAADLRRIWTIPDGPLPSLVGLIESAGVPVVLMDCFHRKQSATSHRGKWCEWIIAVNDDHPASRLRFTIAHELGHIVLGHETSVGMDETETARIEDEADAFASAFLMPRPDALRELRAVNFRRLVQLKQRWNVSIAFLIRRSLDCGTITPHKRTGLEIQLNQQPGGRRSEPAEFSREVPTLIKNMIDALRRDGMSHAEIGDLAGIAEERLRQVYLGEIPKLRAVQPDRPRTVIELKRP